jgi:hypothetical protein
MPTRKFRLPVEIEVDAEVAQQGRKTEMTRQTVEDYLRAAVTLEVDEVECGNTIGWTKIEPNFDGLVEFADPEPEPPQTIDLLVLYDNKTWKVVRATVPHDFDPYDFDDCTTWAANNPDLAGAYGDIESVLAYNVPAKDD